MLDSDQTPNSLDQFNSVEALASQIFDRMPVMPEDGTSNADRATQHSSTSGNLRALNRGEMSEKSRLLSLTEQVVASLLVALDDRQTQSQHVTPATPNTSANSHDIGYRAAYQRARLPEGVEALQGKSVPVSEDETMASIQSMMIAQQEDLHKARVEEKRAYNREILPPIEPQESFAPGPEAISPRRGLRHWTLRQLQRFCRNYYVLAFSLSGWSTLAMMVFIDPAVSMTLCLSSLFLLFMAFCMFSDQNTV